MYCQYDHTSRQKCDANIIQQAFCLTEPSAGRSSRTKKKSQKKKQPVVKTEVVKCTKKVETGLVSLLWKVKPFAWLVSSPAYVYTINR